MAQVIQVSAAGESVYSEREQKLLSTAILLSFITIIYNMIEGGVATYFGYEDETIALFGFGVDSFIEVISGIGIAHMALRMRATPKVERDSFERTALRITGTAFYLLTAGLVASVIVGALQQHEPETTSMGSIIAALSIGVMWLLIRAKRRVGKELDSEPILADANCTMVCMYMSITLLASSLLFTLTGIGYMDIIGAAVLGWFSFSEGKECFEKAASDKYCGCSDSCSA